MTSQKIPKRASPERRLDIRPSFHHALGAKDRTTPAPRPIDPAPRPSLSPCSCSAFRRPPSTAPASLQPLLLWEAASLQGVKQPPAPRQPPRQYLCASARISQLCSFSTLSRDPGSPGLQKVEDGPKFGLEGLAPSWDYPPEQSLLQWWSRNRCLHTRLGKLLLRDGTILSKQCPMSPAGHLPKTSLDVALEPPTHRVLKMNTGLLTHDQIAINSFMIAPSLPQAQGTGRTLPPVQTDTRDSRDLEAPAR